MILNLDTVPHSSFAAIDSDGNSLTYGEILELAELLKSKLPSRSFLFLLSQNNCGGIAWIMASIIAGHVPLILNHAINEDFLNNLISIYSPQYLCYPVSDGNRNETLFEKFGYSISRLGNPPAKLNVSLSHLLPTSGSTGSPKLVRHKYGNIEAAAQNISELFGLTSSDRPLMVLPLYYTMGLSMVFSHLKVGATILITDKKMTDPIFWKFMKEERATSFTGVPFSYEILDKMRFFRMNLPDLKLLTQGGGKMPLELNLKFAEYCQQSGKRWIATYGQSEGTARMAWLPPQYAVSKVGSIGIAVPNGQLYLINEENKVIRQSPAQGELCYRGKNVTMGYATCKEDLELGDERNGMLQTGDMAYRDEDGFYYITGRKGRFLKLFGNRVSLDECEEILKSKLPCDIACTGNDDKLVVCITDSNYEDESSSILSSHLKLPSNIIEVKIFHKLPKNEIGKILYSKLN